MKNSFIVGKYTLESLTNGMYATPFDLYREYIQNAVDSIDISNDKKNNRIDIIVDSKKREIQIIDNGRGIEADRAVNYLVDIGNSKKSRKTNRGFRGIGRLSGLSYCESLVFETSFKGESIKTIVKFDAKKLKKLLMPTNNEKSTIHDVLDSVIEIVFDKEKEQLHYFRVVLDNVIDNNQLLDYDSIKEYLSQNSPVPFNPNFKWGHTINKKLELHGFSIPSYNLFLTFNDHTEQIFKPYSDAFISDRIKRTEDNISDIIIREVKRGDTTIALVWYALSNFYGTITDSSIKGLRLRQGNILVGNKSTCSSAFKEERFNGWVLGEIHALSDDLIANSRRDSFEQNDERAYLIDGVRETAIEITKEIRKLSYARSSDNNKKRVIEAALEDENSLNIEEIELDCEPDEFSLMYAGESELEFNNEFVDKLEILLKKKKNQTRYPVLNINSKLTIEQRKTLERVFDIICNSYDKKVAELFINTITNKY